MGRRGLIRGVYKLCLICFSGFATFAVDFVVPLALLKGLLWISMDRFDESISFFCLLLGLFGCFGFNFFLKKT